MWFKTFIKIILINNTTIFNIIEQLNICCNNHPNFALEITNENLGHFNCCDNTVLRGENAKKLKLMALWGSDSSRAW